MDSDAHSLGKLNIVHIGVFFFPSHGLIYAIVENKWLLIVCTCVFYVCVCLLFSCCFFELLESGYLVYTYISMLSRTLNWFTSVYVLRRGAMGIILFNMLLCQKPLCLHCVVVECSREALMIFSDQVVDLLDHKSAYSWL